jgi:5-methylcytosine-specific restriction endonuclease McrA
MPIIDKEKRKEYQRTAHRKYRVMNKHKVIELLGGKCVRCGYKDDVRALEIDHIVPLRRGNKGILATEKGARLHQLILLGKVNITTLQLLCSNCHNIKTYEDLYKK